MDAAPPIYLDYNATTPVDTRVFEAMRPYFTEHFGNAASAHAWGWAASAAVDAARAHVAAMIGAEPAEIVFTSGATEAANLAIKGVAARYTAKGRHLVTAATEHRAVLDAHARLARDGCDVTVLPVDADGLVSPGVLDAAIRPDTLLVSLMRANNETGVLHSTEALYAVCRARGVFLFVDATQAPGKLPAADVARIAAHADLAAFAAHKFYGPKGAGALYVRRRDPRVALAPLVEGGGQERGFRSGTLAVPLIVGMGEAARLVLEGADDPARLTALRDQLEVRLEADAGAVVNGRAAARLPNTSSLAFPGVRADRLLAALGGSLALATGSACASAKPEASHVLRALGLSDEAARASIRISLGRPTSAADVNAAAERIVAAVRVERGR